MSESRLHAVATPLTDDEPSETIDEARPEGAWWGWQPVHGGAGVTTINRALPGGHVFRAGGEDHARWPSLPVVAVARSHAAGLLAAQQFAGHVAATPGWEVLGLVVVADVPGRLPRQLEQLFRLISGGFSQPRQNSAGERQVGKVWWASWVEAWRCGNPVTMANTPESYRSILRDLATVTAMPLSL